MRHEHRKDKSESPLLDLLDKDRSNHRSKPKNKFT